MFVTFYDQLYKAIEIFTLVSLKTHCTYPIKLSEKLTSPHKRKNEVHHIVSYHIVILNLQHFKTNFQLLAMSVKKCIEYSRYIKNFQRSVINYPKYFWTFFKVKNSTTNLPSLMYYTNIDVNGNHTEHVLKNIFL